MHHSRLLEQAICLVEQPVLRCENVADAYQAKSGLVDREMVGMVELASAIPSTDRLWMVSRKQVTTGDLLAERIPVGNPRVSREYVIS